jgi:uncharacterized protein YhaN
MSDKTRIKRLKIDHYGPLGDIDIELDEGLNVFYGRNESGKTLIVESLTKMLVDDSSSFQGISRVKQQPTGMLTVEKDGEEIEASQEKLGSLFDNVNASDIRNAFIIRDFDLRLPERENDFGNGSYFNEVTDRVLGSKTKKIEGIRDEIADINYLTNSTSDAIIENRKDSGHIREKKEKAEDLQEEIEDFLGEIRKKGFIQKYSRLDSIKRQIKSKEEQIEKLEEARKQSKYREGQKLLEQLKEIEKQLNELEDEEKQLEEAETLQEKAKNFEDIQISGYSFYRKVSIASGLLSAISLLTVLAYPNPVSILSALIFFSAAGYAAYRYRQSDVELEKNDREKEELIKKAISKDIHAESLHDIVEDVDRWRDDLKNRQHELISERGEITGTFKGDFNTDSENPKEWKNTLEEYRTEFEEVDQEYEEKSIRKYEEKVEELKNERDHIQKEIRDYNQQIQEYNSRISNTLVPEFIDDEVANIEVFEDLETGLSQLEEFTDSVEEMLTSSTQALEILEQIEKEEEDEFNKIFKDDSYAIEIFREATDGNYTDISYDKQSRKLKVERSDGKILSPEQLSQGTYDLLYMAVRLKLAKEILGEPGFLVLDNAFVHSDLERIEREIKFLQKLEDNGWQIIYFTFRDDVKKQLEEVTEVRNLERIEFEK